MKKFQYLFISFSYGTLLLDFLSIRALMTDGLFWLGIIMVLEVSCMIATLICGGMFIANAVRSGNTKSSCLAKLVLIPFYILNFIFYVIYFLLPIVASRGLVIFAFPVLGIIYFPIVVGAVFTYLTVLITSIPIIVADWRSNKENQALNFIPLAVLDAVVLLPLLVLLNNHNQTALIVAGLWLLFIIGLNVLIWKHRRIGLRIVNTLSLLIEFLDIIAAVSITATLTRKKEN